MPVTKMFPPNIKPVRIGEYLASVTPEEVDCVRRWWNGKSWSIGYFDNESETTKMACRLVAAHRPIYWKGLTKT